MSDLRDRRLQMIDDILDEMMSKEERRIGGHIVAIKIGLVKPVLKMLDEDGIYLERAMYLLMRACQCNQFYLTAREIERLKKLSYLGL